MPLISIFGVVDDRMKVGSLRRCLSLLLVVSLLAAGPGFAQIPSTPQSPQPGPPGRPTPSQTSAPAAPSASRGLTPGPDYRLGPRALLDIQIAGRLEVIRQQTVVDLEGVINVPPLGALSVAGCTMLDLHSRLSARGRE